MKKILTDASRLWLFLGLLLVSFGGLSSQSVRIYLEDVQAQVASTVEVPVRVSSFQAIAGAQFSVNWDPAKLSFLGVENLALGATAAGNFNIASVEQGKLGYIIADLNLQGFNLEDASSLFSIRFNVLMSDNSATLLRFSGDPVSQVVADLMSNAVSAEYEEGQVIVGFPTALMTAVANDPRLQALPNPFTDVTRLQHTATRSGEGVLEVFTSSGQLILRRKHDIQAGENSLLLQSKDLPVLGVYLLRLTTKDGIFSRKLIRAGA